MRIQAGPREWGRERGGGGAKGQMKLRHYMDGTPLRFLVSFLLEDKTSAPDVFSSCSFIPGAHFESSSLIVSFYG